MGPVIKKVFPCYDTIIKASLSSRFLWNCYKISFSITLLYRWSSGCLENLITVTNMILCNNDKGDIYRHIDTETKWPLFSRQYCQMHFIFHHFDENSLKFVTCNPGDNEHSWFRWWPDLNRLQAIFQVQVSLSELTKTHFTDAHMIHNVLNCGFLYIDGSAIIHYCAIITS